MATTYKINEFIVLKLENGRTNIYVKDKLFNQCKYILLSFTNEEIPDYNEFTSIDEAIAFYNKQHETDKTILTPETEFWGHCSNIQAWVENDYNLNILHSSLSIPLLRRLVEIGDKKALIRLKEEIVLRLKDGNEKTLLYFLDKQYIHLFELEELEILFEQISITDQILLKKVNDLINRKRIIEKYKQLKHQKIIIEKRNGGVY